MDNLNILINEKNKYLEQILDTNYCNIEKFIINNNNFIFKLIKKTIKSFIFYVRIKNKNNILLKKYINTISKQNKFVNTKINTNIINKNNNVPIDQNNNKNIYLKLEDINAIKIFVQQLEEKENIIIKLTKKINKLQTNIFHLGNTINKQNIFIVELEKNKANIDNTNNDLIDKLQQKNYDLENKKEQIENLEQKVFELEGVKKIQYETIHTLKENNKKQFNKINVLKENFKALVDDFNLIVKKIN